MNGAKKSLPDAIRIACANEAISFREFIQLALYHPETGYYTQKKDRVGRSAKRDFYTAESLGPVFATLVATAAEDLLGTQRAAEAEFVEIAAEPGAELLSHLKSHPFARSRVIRQGEPSIVEGPAVVFANEWLDALPFHRLIFRQGRWHERGVRLDHAGALEEVLLPELTTPVRNVAYRLPGEALEGYELDLPLEAECALRNLLNDNWRGLLILFDYGKTWKVLTEESPAGTARTYFQHNIGLDLLARPGEEDITCHLCWDPLEAILLEHNLSKVTLETQENFLVRRAGRAASAIVSESANGFSDRRQTLMELMHPSHMGRRFQVLWGLRED
ncbi:MAG: SAM-dependent methyltransferase [Verrucomicrobiota bacterium]